ncbi:MAG: ribonuclease J, partial [Lachnospiraceae bacterium]|nr:ribonuclease J [Lachnospiraceae bacterium]
QEAKVVGTVPFGSIFVDGLGVGDVGNVVLRDRQRLADDGIIIAVLAMDSEGEQVLAGPDIVTRGFVYVKESDEILEEMRSVVNATMYDMMISNVRDWGKIKNNIKDAVGDYVWKKTKRRPMILPVIMAID